MTGESLEAEKMKMEYFVCGETKEGELKTVDLSNSSGLTVVADGEYTKKLQCISEIGTGAFRNCESVQKVILPVSVSEIGESAFEGCKDLKIVEYKETKDSQSSNQTEASNQSEEHEQSGKSSNDEQNVKISVHANAFKDCSSLETVIFPRLREDGTITIAKNAFAGCTKLRTVVLRGKGTFNIHPEAFCHSREVTLVVTKGSDAETFAVEYGIKCKPVKDSKSDE